MSARLDDPADPSAAGGATAFPAGQETSAHPPSAEVPWAMQVAVLHDKVHPASHIAAAETVARAVVGLPASAGAAPGGEWHERVRLWRDGRIRKLVRRARGVRWDEVQALPGVTVVQDDDGHPAAARAFVPGPVRPLPVQLAKLQVEGTELPDDRLSTSTDALVRIGVNPHVAMTTGKLAAQCGHAAQLAWELLAERGESDLLAAWSADGFRVRVELVDDSTWAADAGDVQVVDAGFTELDGPTETTRAWIGR